MTLPGPVRPRCLLRYTTGDNNETCLLFKIFLEKSFTLGVYIPAAGDDPRVPEPVELIFRCDTLHYVPDKPGYLMTLGSTSRPGDGFVLGLKDKWPPFRDQYKFTVDDFKEWAAATG